MPRYLKAVSFKLIPFIPAGYPNQISFSANIPSYILLGYILWWYKNLRSNSKFHPRNTLSDSKKDLYCKISILVQSTTIWISLVPNCTVNNLLVYTSNPSVSVSSCTTFQESIISKDFSTEILEYLSDLNNSAWLLTK